MSGSPTHPQTASKGQAPRSQLAVAAFITSLALCCPLTGMVAVFLGFLAHRRITASGGRLGGRRLALAAIAIGTASTVIWLFSWDAFGKWYLEALEERMLGTTRSMIEDAAEGDLAAASLGFDPASTPEQAELAEFGVAIADRFGELIDIELKDAVMLGDTLDPRMEVRLVLDFDPGGIRYGAGAFSLRARALDDVIPQPKFLWIEIVDPPSPLLRLGSEPAGTGTDPEDPAAGMENGGKGSQEQPSGA
ncbi:MAG: DUF4190 domain-containing protein [Phycisphaerales bacterium]|nr:DUF4190 domain-containing protein [Phycisphaerales bacterium]